MGQEILRTQPVEPGWGFPPTGGLLLGEGQPEGHCLPLSIVQGLRYIEAFPHSHAPYGNPFTGPDLFPPVRVDFAMIHQLGWFTGFSFPFSHDWDQAAGGLAWTVVQAPPM